MKASEVSGSLSYSLLILLFCTNHEKVLSTIHLFGKKGLVGSFCGMNLFVSMATPSLSHSLISTPSSPLREPASVGVAQSLRSTPIPSPPSRPPCLLRCSPRPAIGGTDARADDRARLSPARA